MSSKMNICARTCSASSTLTCSRPSRIMRSVERSARLMIATSGGTPPTVRQLLRAENRRHPAVELRSTSRMTSGEACSMRAIRCATSACSFCGKPERTIADCAGPRWASTRAIVCGCSSARKVMSCRASARRRASNGMSARRRAEAIHDLFGALGADAAREQLLGQLDAAAAGDRVGEQRGVRLADDGLGVVPGDVAQPHDLGGELLDHRARAAWPAPWRPGRGRAGRAGSRPCAGRSRRGHGPASALPLGEPALHAAGRSRRAGSRRTRPAPAACARRRGGSSFSGAASGAAPSAGRPPSARAPASTVPSAGRSAATAETRVAPRGRRRPPGDEAAGRAAPGRCRLLAQDRGNSRCARRTGPRESCFAAAFAAVVSKATELTWTLSPRAASSPTALPTSCWMSEALTPVFGGVQHDGDGEPLDAAGAAWVLVTTVPMALSTVRSDLL